MFVPLFDSHADFLWCSGRNAGRGTGGGEAPKAYLALRPVPASNPILIFSEGLLSFRQYWSSSLGNERHQLGNDGGVRFFFFVLLVTNEMLIWRWKRIGVDLPAVLQALGRELLPFNQDKGKGRSWRGAICPCVGGTNKTTGALAWHLARGPGRKGGNLEAMAFWRPEDIWNRNGNGRAKRGTTACTNERSSLKARYYRYLFCTYSSTRHTTKIYASNASDHVGRV